MKYLHYDSPVNHAQRAISRFDARPHRNITNTKQNSNIAAFLNTSINSAWQDGYNEVYTENSPAVKKARISAIKKAMNGNELDLALEYEQNGTLLDESQICLIKAKIEEATKNAYPKAGEPIALSEAEREKRLADSVKKINEIKLETKGKIDGQKQELKKIKQQLKDLEKQPHHSGSPFEQERLQKIEELKKQYGDAQDELEKIKENSKKRIDDLDLNGVPPRIAKCMALLPPKKAEFKAGKGLSDVNYSSVIEEVDRLKQKCIDQILDLIANSFPEATKSQPIAARIAKIAKQVTDAAKCAAHTIKIVNETINNYVKYANDAINWAVEQKRALDRLFTSMLKDLDFIKEHGVEYLKEAGIQTVILSIEGALKRFEFDKAIGNIIIACKAIDDTINLGYSTINNGISVFYQFKATFNALKIEMQRWQALDLMEKMMRDERNTVSAMRMPNNYLDGFDDFLKNIVPSSYSFSLTNCGFWPSYSMSDPLNLIPKLQGYVKNYRQDTDSSFINVDQIFPLKRPTHRKLVKTKNLEGLEDLTTFEEVEIVRVEAVENFLENNALLVSNGVFIDARDTPGNIIVDDTEFGLISCGLGPTVDPEVFLIFDLVIDDGDTIVTAIARGGDASSAPDPAAITGQYVTCGAYDLKYSMIFPVVVGGDSGAKYSRLDDLMNGVKSINGNDNFPIWGYGHTGRPDDPLGGYNFDTWELIVDDADRLSSLKPGEVFAYQNPNTCLWHGQRIWIVKKGRDIRESKQLIKYYDNWAWQTPEPDDEIFVRLIPYEYQVKEILGESVYIERVKNIMGWVEDDESPIKVKVVPTDNGDSVILDLDGSGNYQSAGDLFEPVPYYKPFTGFGMGGNTGFVDGDYGLTGDDFVECLDACPPMAIIPPFEAESAPTLYSSAYRFSGGTDETWNMAVKEEFITLTRMFGVTETPTVPHALDSIKCHKWSLYVRFSGPTSKVRALNFIKSDNVTKVDHFYLKAKWGFETKMPENVLAMFPFI